MEYLNDLDVLVDDIDLAYLESIVSSESPLIPTDFEVDQVPKISISSNNSQNNVSLSENGTPSDQLNPRDINQSAQILKDNTKLQRPKKQAKKNGKTINHSRRRSQVELASLRSEASELENQYNTLSKQYYLNLTESKLNTSSKVLWKQIAAQQKEYAKLAMTENELLHSKLRQQADWIQSLQALTYDPSHSENVMPLKIDFPRYNVKRVISQYETKWFDLYHHLQQVINQTAQIMTKYGLINLYTPIQDAFVIPDDMVRIIGTSCLITPVSLHVAVSTIWRNYNLNQFCDLDQTLDKNSHYVIAEGILQVRSRTIPGTIAIQTEYIDAQTARLAFVFTGVYVSPNGIIAQTQETVWIFFETKKNSSDNMEDVRTFVRVASQTSIEFIINGITCKMPDAEVHNIFTEYQIFKEEAKKRFENGVMDTLLESFKKLN